MALANINLISSFALIRQICTESFVNCDFASQLMGNGTLLKLFFKILFHCLEHPPSPEEKADQEKPVPEIYKPDEGQLKPEEIFPQLSPKERKLAEELGELPSAETVQIIPPTFLQVLEPQVVRDGEPVKFTAKVCSMWLLPVK